MFTGIIKEIGTIRSISPNDSSIRLEISAPHTVLDARLGDSIAINGVCLTVAERTEGGFYADCMKQTLDLTNLGDLEPGAEVNVEPALAVGESLSGHIVQGHVDCTTRLLSRTHTPTWDVLRLELPAAYARYIVSQGSVCLNGTSLTVSRLGEEWFEVSLIPTTLRDTIFGSLPDGAQVNIEFDILAKYIERMMHRTDRPA